MKTRTQLVITWLLAAACLSAEVTPYDISDGIYIPSREETAKFVQLHQYLVAYNQDRSAKPDSPVFSELIDRSIEVDDIQSYLFDAFMRSTTNEQVISFYLDYVSSKGIQARNVMQISDLLKARAKQQKTPSAVLTEDGRVEEGINLFRLGVYQVFGGRLNLLVFADNKYMKITPNEKAGQSPFDGESLFCGGGSNTILVTVAKHDLEMNQFETTMVKNDRVGKDYENWKIVKLADEGCLADIRAEGRWMGYGARRLDDPEDYIEARLRLYLYSDLNKEGYEIDYFINLSGENWYFDHPDRIISSFLEMPFFTRVN